MTIIVKDEVDFAEESFYDPSLLETEYMQRYREGYYHCREGCFRLNSYRNYLSIINYFNEIHQYQKTHAASFSKRIKAQQKNWKECESIVSEVIVYHSYLRPMYEGLVSSISLETDECDVIVERCNGLKYYLEVFCIMPDFPEEGLIDIKTHTQTAFSSVRQKLLNKARKQGQFLKERENFAVIELNNHSIAYDFTVLSSLSDGYKINIDLETMKSVNEGYDWNSSVFELPETRFLKGIIWFHMGAYQYRKTLLNAYYRREQFE
jgi:hypothetical protein